MQINIKDILLNYQILGGRNKETILVLPGWGRSIQEWYPLSQELAAHKKVILVDLPGFGGSTLPQKPFDTFDCANYLKTFLEKIKIKKVTIIGHSYGGKTAIILAHQLNKKVEKLILITPSGLPRPLHFKILNKLTWGFKNTLGLILPAVLVEKLINLLASRDLKQAGELSESFKKIVSQNVTKEAAGLKQKALIVWGDQDRILPIKQIKIFKRIIPNSKIRIVWGAGHDPHLQKVKLLEEIIKEEL